MNLGRYEEALQYFERSLKVHPADPSALVFKGVVLIHLSQHEEALAALDQALQLSPRHSEALVFRGAALNHLHRYNECYESYEQVLEINQQQKSRTKSVAERLSQLATDIYTRLMSFRTL